MIPNNSIENQEMAKNHAQIKTGTNQSKLELGYRKLNEENSNLRTSLKEIQSKMNNVIKSKTVENSIIKKKLREI